MTARADKEAAQILRACIARERFHLRAGDKRQDGTEVRHVGSASELHGVDGLCVCCHGRGD